MPDSTLTVQSVRVSELASPAAMAARDLMPALRRGLEIWNEARGDRARPQRADMDPTVLRDILPNLILWDIVEAEKGREFVVRVAGEAATLGRGGRFKGYTLIDFHAERFEPVWTEFDQVRRTGKLHYSERTAHWASCPFYYYYRLMLPLGDETAVTHLVSVIDYERGESGLAG